MLLEHIFLLLFALLIIWAFWYQRSLAEIARNFAQQHCQQRQVQFISIALVKRGFTRNKRGTLTLKTEFNFEFSGDGESRYEGQIILIGKQLADIQMPAYKSL
ncbi:DUF3301 domain-containing protein [Flocculibacter collagenilyticus]|uniref:DUF3301 domain-containing protein n=1 Tax=Flocculibacter collagenilyticus TaxID=2744479 RepID=UPI0018F45926|nr:DUF3301 domain-containing protein [Flocculibacter collagenilyticus]